MNSCIGKRDYVGDEFQKKLQTISKKNDAKDTAAVKKTLEKREKEECKDRGRKNEPLNLQCTSKKGKLPCLVHDNRYDLDSNTCFIWKQTLEGWMVEGKLSQMSENCFLNDDDKALCDKKHWSYFEEDDDDDDEDDKSVGPDIEKGTGEEKSEDKGKDKVNNEPGIMKSLGNIISALTSD